MILNTCSSQITYAKYSNRNRVDFEVNVNKTILFQFYFSGEFFKDSSIVIGILHIILVKHIGKNNEKKVLN